MNNQIKNNEREDRKMRKGRNNDHSFKKKQKMNK